jgi:hypothetical protein
MGLRLLPPTNSWLLRGGRVPIYMNWKPDVGAPTTAPAREMYSLTTNANFTAFVQGDWGICSSDDAGWAPGPPRSISGSGWDDIPGADRGRALRALESKPWASG